MFSVYMFLLKSVFKLFAAHWGLLSNFLCQMYFCDSNPSVSVQLAMTVIPYSEITVYECAGLLISKYRVSSILYRRYFLGIDGVIAATSEKSYR